MNNMFKRYAGTMRSASQSGARRAGALAIAALLVLVVAIAMVVAGCPDDSANGTTTVTYTCENGTPVDGTPSGTSNVERCASCVSGYTLSGSAGADGATCMKDAVDSTAPTFTDGPTVDGTTDTGATVKLTADEAGKLFWVLYADGTAAPVTAAALIQDASGDSAGVKRSGASQTVDAATEKTVTITGLEAGITYNFYAVLQDSAGNTSDLSKKLEITTAMTTTTGSYTCENGIAKGGTPTGSTDVEACQSCSDGFKLMAPSGGAIGDDGTTCVAESTAVYTCDNGTAKSGNPGGTADIVACQSCMSGFKLKGAANVDGTTCVVESTAVYTCENGMPQDGTPSGSTDVAECTSCDVGFTLANKQCTDITTPTFSAAPTLDGSPTANGATVKLTASEAGKLFWVVYAGSDPSPDTAAALIKEASDDSTAGAARSGTSVTLTNAEKTVTLSGLTAGSTYNFYAVLQDSAGNIGAVSATLGVTTATTASYTCENGNAKTDPLSGSTDMVACQSCDSGFKLKGAAGITGTTCEATVYTCENGMPQDGKPTGNDDVAECKACDSTYKLVNNACTTRTVYTCSNGAAKTDNPAGNSDVEGCSSCDSGYKLGGTGGDDCVATVYTCENGTAKSGKPNTNADVVACTSCMRGYKLSGAAGEDTTACVEDSTAPTFNPAPMVDGSPNENSATVKLTSDEAGTLFWVLYTDTTVVANAAALIKDVTADPKPSTVVARSAPAGVAVTTAEATVTLTGLAPKTSYDFYAVLQDAAGNTTLSAKLDIATATGYTCTDGMPKTGSPGGSDNVGACQSCNSGFKLMGDAGVNGTTCVATVYTCPANGTAKTGSPAGNSDVAECAECDNRYKLVGGACEATVYTCSNGTAKAGSPIGHADRIYCASCTDNTHVVAAGACVPDNQFTLHPNGVTIVCPGVADDATGDIGGTTYTKRTAATIKADPAKAATTCTSGITDMSNLFFNKRTFNGNISHWDTSSVTDMTFIFAGDRDFNQDIGLWDTSNVTVMASMFNNSIIQGAVFNQDIGGWDVSKVSDMGGMFLGLRDFNQDIGNWDVSKVTDMQGMFNSATAFNQDIGGWDVSKVASMKDMFVGTIAFNQNIGDWDVSKVTNMNSMFFGATDFNQDLSGWCVFGIKTAPSSFATGATAFTAGNMPNWGAACSQQN